MSPDNDQLPVQLAGQPIKPMPTLGLLTVYGKVLRLVMRFENQIARTHDAAPRSQLQAQLDQQLELIVTFEEKYGMWALPSSAAPTAPVSPPPAMQQPTTQKSTMPQPTMQEPFFHRTAFQQPVPPVVPTNSTPTSMPSFSIPSSSMPPGNLLGTPPQSSRGGLNRSVFSQTNGTGQSDVTKISQVPAGSQDGKMRTIIEWKTFANNADPKADVMQTQQTFAEIWELARTCEPDRAAYYQRTRPATFRDFRNVEISDNMQYKHDNGKVGPYRYGARPEAELWLCFATFHTFEVCPHGARCRYRHLMLTVHEILWIAKSERGRRCLEETYFRCWNAKGGKQPVHQARALPIPISANAAAKTPRPMLLPRPGIAAQNVAAAELKRKADGAEVRELKRRRK